MDDSSPSTAPDELRECLQCKCKTRCITLRCSCLKSGLRCTDVCGCVDCRNGRQEEKNSEENDEEELSDSSDLSDCDEDSDDNFFQDRIHIFK